MFQTSATWLRIVLSVAVAGSFSYFITPWVRVLASKIGAIDVPDGNRHIHKKPTPRLGGLAIYFGFLCAVFLFTELTYTLRGILLGSALIVLLGAVDDKRKLGAWTKLLFQIVAAVIAVLHGVTIEMLRDPTSLTESGFLVLGALAVPVSIIWIVGITNSVNLIDGLDGLAAGVSVISSIAMFVVAMLSDEINVALVIAALIGGCLGFLPYNLNPAKIFMGDTGSLMLGYLLATISIVGMFKLYAVFTFIVPVIALALPLFDTAFAIIRRLLNKQSPFCADRRHLHHKLLDIGFTQKQAVAVLYAFSAIMGIFAVFTATRGAVSYVLLAVSAASAVAVGIYIRKTLINNKNGACDSNEQIPGGNTNEKN